jgi:hypothetical protein
MGTVYRSICECLASPPEPDFSAYPADSLEWERDHQRWDEEWTARVNAHHAYCCEASRQGPLDQCLQNEPESCPFLHRDTIKLADGTVGKVPTDHPCETCLIRDVCTRPECTGRCPDYFGLGS